MLLPCGRPPSLFNRVILEEKKMRDVSKSDRNVGKIYDKLGKGDVYFYFRMPTTAERAAYDKALLKFKGKKPLNKAFETNLTFGKLLCTGLRLAKKDPIKTWVDGLCFEGKPFSSESKDEGYYRQDWKEIIIETSSDLLVQLAAFIFNAAGVEEDDDDIDSDDGSPLPGASSSSET